MIPAKPKLHIEGMLGLGDNLHQRAIIRQFIDTYDIYLETTWPSVYHDFPDIKFIRRNTPLRTQTKNADRENDKFHSSRPANAETKKVWYRPDQVRAYGSVLGAMLISVGANPHRADFSLPIPFKWKEKAVELLYSELGITKPIMIYRPLIERKEWGGCASRNPDFDSYHELFNSVRDDYFVISIADIVPDVEWIVSHPIQADVEFHSGEIEFEKLAAVFAEASLVYCSPGFAAVLGKAVSTPVITIFGGYENSKSFTLGDAPYLGIDPINPCQCFSHNHPCDKRIDITKAKQSIREFLDAIATSNDKAKAD